MNAPPTLETQGYSPKPIRLVTGAVFVLLAIIALGIYIRQSLQNSCETTAVAEASAILFSQTRVYDGVYQVASTASRTYLDPPIITLQQIFMDTQEVKVPACMSPAKQELLGYMKTAINALQAFADHEADATIRTLVSQSENHYTNFIKELNAVKQCTPFCIQQLLKKNG
jgi:hypothetical protein